MTTHHAALIYTMVLVSAADREMPDRELESMGDMVAHLPVFRDFGRALGPDGEPVVVVARDDHELAAGWIDARLEQLRQMARRAHIRMVVKMTSRITTSRETISARRCR